MESDEDVVELRVAVDDDYDDIVYLKIDRKIINTMILEDDNICLLYTSPSPRD